MPPRRREQKRQEPTEAEAVAIIAGALAVGASAQATAEVLNPQLGIPVSVLLPVLVIAMSKPVNYGIATIPSATASAESSNLEATYRAHYIHNATLRLKGLRGDARVAALKAEQRYFNQHLDAVKNRKEAAASVDVARSRYGDELGWYAKMDSRTSEECREANGRNFNASVLPPIGYPGAVHPHCRCKPGKAHRTSKTVYTVQPREVKAA